MFGELVKRLVNIFVCWCVVAILPSFMFLGMVFCGVHKVVMDKWPSDDCEKYFKMMVCGEKGVFDLSKKEA